MQENISKAEEAQDSQRQMDHARPIQRSARFGWWWEIVAIVLSIASMAGIAALLASLADNPLPQWKISSSTRPMPNVVVSILSTIAKTTLLFPLAACLGQLKWAYFEKRARPVNHLQVFDSATRGPWGSLLFLWEIRGRALLGSLSAIVTILALSFDPFTQLTLDYPVRSHCFANETGQLSVSQKWLNGNDGGRSEADSSLYIPLTVGVLTALGNQDYSPSPNYMCPRSGCEARDVATLSVCSQCNIQTINNTNLDCKVNLQVGPRGGDLKTVIIDGAYNDLLNTLPDLQDNNNDYHLTLDCEQQPAGFPNIPLRLGVDLLGSNLSAALAQPQPAQGTYGSKQEMEWDAGSSSPHLMYNSTDGRTDATLKYCIYDSPGFYEQPTMSLAKASCFTSNTDLTLYQDLFESKLIRQDTPLTDTYQHQIAKAESGSNASYDIGMTAWGDTQARFLQVANPTNPTNESNDTNDWFIVQSILKPTNRTNGTAIDNFPLLFHRFAVALESIVQSSGNPDTENKTMNVSGLETYVEVTWAYLTLPFLMILFVTVFLIISIVESRKQDYLLKTSSLAVMYHGLDLRDLGNEYGDVEGDVRTKTTDKDLVEESKVINAVFVHDGRMRLKKD